MSYIAISLLLLVAASQSLASPINSRHPIPAVANHAGFEDATVLLSAGGKAHCITRNIPVFAGTTSNENLLLSSPTNQRVVTNLIVEYSQVSSTLTTVVDGGDKVLSGIFNINAKLCYPLDWNAAKSSKTIQFLIHGIAFDKAYWDFAEGYSYVDAAAMAGYPTFSYDRLGVGASDHPDPIQVVQSPIQVEIAHSLIQSLRRGAFAGQSFSHVVGVGHSFGSIQSARVTAQYPKDFDAVVLTGFSTDTAGMSSTFLAFNPAIAKENDAERFGDLPNGYLVTDSPISNRLTFLRAPNFDPRIFAKDDATKQAFTIGELFTLGRVIQSAVLFTGPVDVVNGEFDFIFCQSNCDLPVDQSALVLEILYPAAGNGSQTIIIPGLGHAVNVHYEAPQAFQHIIEFVKGNGF